MTTLITALLCYIGFGALTCASPRNGEWTPREQWDLFRETLRDVLIWPVALWRDFGSF
jgi:hypothetical protein